MIELSRDGARYRVVVRSPAGEFTSHSDLDPARITTELGAVQANVLASSARVRAVRPVMSALEGPLRRLGSTLFEAVLEGQAGALFTASRNEVERRGEVCRIVLRLPAELAVLPWELLYDVHRGEYVCRRSALVRYVDTPETVRRLQVDGPLRILGMTALPGNLAALDADAERDQLTEALAPLQHLGLVELEWVQGQRWEDLMGALLSGTYHLFHFIGHGGFDTLRGEGVIAFADSHNRAQPVSASQLADLLTVSTPMPHLVVLNSCGSATGVATDVFSSTGATLVRRIPAVVAMQFSITDDAAKAFSAAFYQALAHNRGVDEAVRTGRIALSGWHADTLEWITPVLYMRSHDSRLLALAPPRPPHHPVADERPRPPSAPSVHRSAPAVLPQLTHSLSGPSATVWTVAFSSDGALLAGGSDDATVYLWDPTSGAGIGALTGDGGPVYAVAFGASNGPETINREVLATAGSEGTVRLWTPPAHQRFGALTGAHLRPVRAMAFSPDGALLATGSDDSTVGLWNPLTGQQLHVLTRHDGPVYATAFSPDGAILATGGWDGSIRLWNPATGLPLGTLVGHTWPVRAVAFSPDGALLASGSEDRSVRLWNPVTGRLVGILTGHTDWVYALAFSPDGTTLASSGRDSTVRLWNLATSQYVGTLTGYQQSVWAVAFSPDGTTLATAGRDSSVRLWKLHADS
ncbi:CHAT domain-containing protein [Streptomyces specialis]|uniref:CHAT domain-containing protein n=1 Tax=Streptomyces specialis TaxID=498367 RepID=UPI00131E6AD8|nr:CHAT domain-containing protein [Streptomyces specialis]